MNENEYKIESVVLVHKTMDVVRVKSAYVVVGLDKKLYSLRTLKTWLKRNEGNVFIDMKYKPVRSIEFISIKGNIDI